MARPKKTLTPKVRPQSIHFRVNDDMYDIIVMEANRAKLSISEYCRKIVLEHTVNIYEEVIFDSEKLLKKLGDLGRIGNNLNQIARHLNEGNTFDKNMKTQVNSCISELLNIRDVIFEMAGEYRGDC